MSSARPDAKPASWVIRNKLTGEVVCETFDEQRATSLNTVKYEAVPIMKYLQELNKRRDPYTPQANNATAVAVMQDFLKVKP